jgi:small subunit ribosomal protein S2
MSQNNSALIERLFKAGAHFGFTKSRRHPSMVPYIYGTKLGTDIIDLEKSATQLAVAKEALMQAGEQGKTVLFVGTKNEAAKLVERFAKEADMPYVINRWIGGMLTNYTEIRKRLERYKALVAERDSGELERKYVKKERVIIGREIDKLEYNFGGIVKSDRTPYMLVIVDPRHDIIAATEARDTKIPVIGIMGTDGDATFVSKPIVVNDALEESVTLILSELTNAYLEGKKKYTPAPVRTTRPDFGRGPRTVTSA